jgi:hypothetical protein
MTWTTQGFNKGLNLDDQIDQLDTATMIDGIDVVFTNRGTVKTRDGFDEFTSSEGTNRYDSMAAYYTTAGTNQLVCGAGNRLDVLNTSGGVVASSTSPTASPHYFTRFGGPNNEVMYIANGTDTVRQWNGSAFSTPSWVTTTIDGKFLAVTPWDNRLVCAGFNGTTAGDNPNSVRFSNAGDPLTFKANNYVDLTPGDGEIITGVVVWNQRLIVFKQTKFFVFSTTNTDSAGEPIFSYNPVANNRGLYAPGAVAVNDDGVYFVDREGVYRTTGGSAVCVSDNIAPIFIGSPPESYGSGILETTQFSKVKASSFNSQIWVAFPAEGSTFNDRVLVFDIVQNSWTIYAIDAGALCPWRISGRDEMMIAFSTGTKDIVRHSPAYTTDDGTTIIGRFRSGFTDAGSPDRKTVREFKVWGQGDLRYGVGVDYQSSSWVDDLSLGATDLWGDGSDPSDVWGDGTDPSDLWGVGGAPRPAMSRIATQGTLFSFEFSGYSAAPFSVNRVTAYVREVEYQSAIGGS